MTRTKGTVGAMIKNGRCTWTIFILYHLETKLRKSDVSGTRKTKMESSTLITSLT